MPTRKSNCIYRAISYARSQYLASGAAQYIFMRKDRKPNTPCYYEISRYNTPHENMELIAIVQTRNAWTDYLNTQKGKH